MIFKMEFTMADPRMADEDPQTVFFGALRKAFNEGEPIAVQIGEAELTGHGRGLVDTVEGGTVAFAVEMEVDGFGVTPVTGSSMPPEQTTAILDVDRRATIEKTLPDIVDGSWRHSWHWHRGETGRLTAEGWRQALRDINNQTWQTKKRAADLNRAAADVRWVLATFYDEEEDDA